MLGITAMLQEITGDEETTRAVAESIGKTIVHLELGTDDALHFSFSDGSRIRVFDDARSCCETRYMRTDDTLPDFVGAELQGLIVRDAPNMPDEHGDHEVQFLAIYTSKGVFTMSNHNEHNGYYGGISVAVRTEAEE